MSKLDLYGSIVAIITPLTKDGEVDYKSLKNLVDYHVAAGTNGIVVCGTTGEAVTLSDEESLAVIKAVVEFTANRIPVIAGTGSNCTAKAIAYTKKVEALGVDACLTVVPYYNKPSQEGLYQHFKAIAESSALPQILYNVPGRTVTSLDVETIVELAKIPNIIGIKDAHPDLSRVPEIVRLTKDYGFTHLSGDDATGIEAVRLGSRGVISVTANILAEQWSKVMNTALVDFEQAIALNAALKKFHPILFIEPNPTPTKFLAHQLGLIEDDYQRLPLTRISEAGKKTLLDIAETLNIAQAVKDLQSKTQAFELYR